MASLKEEAHWILDDARAGIAWIAIWKTGRSWHTETMYANDVEYTESRGYPWNVKGGWRIEDDAADRLREIWNEDNNAILVNPFYDNLGPFEDMTLNSLVDGIRFQYYVVGCDILAILQDAGKEI